MVGAPRIVSAFHEPLRLLLVLLWTAGVGAQDCATHLPPRTEWYSVHYRQGVADSCTADLREPHVLQVLRPFCVAHGSAFTTCATRPKGLSRILEWYGINRITALPPEQFTARLRSSEVQWINGTSFGSYLGQFPHAVQGLMPLLNLPAMHLPPQRFVQLPAADNFPQGHGLEHRYTMALLKALGDCLGMTPENIVGQREWWATRRDTTVCFGEMVVPLIRYNPCGHVFLEDSWAAGTMGTFRAHLYRSLAIPTAADPPRTITVLHRAGNRQILNKDEVMRMLGDFGWEVKLVQTELHQPFSQQIAGMASTGILLTTHGANMVNAMFLPKGAVAIEVHLHDFWIPCYWGQFLAKMGVNYLKWCYPTGACRFAQDWPTAYPRDNAVVQVDTLRPIVARAVRLVKERLACVYSKQFDCLPSKPSRSRNSTRTLRLSF
eukprot:GGOE01014231.1.p1 GENE.GGOE01014231.1~~GGOE01014231.1.p1  ORF type:complete len:435 (-),score=101.64 GGOE01014231.1:76-1380(-)